MAEQSTAAHELSVSRFIAAPPETVYRMWTERTGEWFAPKPYTTPVVEIDLRPGGRDFITMQAPDGALMPFEGVVLKVVPNKRIVMTSAFTVGWVPQDAPFHMVSIFTFAPEGEGTRHTASARHWNAEACKSHEEMGFQQGWGTCADQLAELAEADASAVA